MNPNLLLVLQGNAFPPTHPLTRVAMLCLTSISSTLRLHEDLWGDGEILQGNPSQCRLPPLKTAKKASENGWLEYVFVLLLGRFDKWLKIVLGGA